MDDLQKSRVIKSLHETIQHIKRDELYGLFFVADVFKDNDIDSGAHVVCEPHHYFNLMSRVDHVKFEVIQDYIKGDLPCD